MNLNKLVCSTVLSLGIGGVTVTVAPGRPTGVGGGAYSSVNQNNNKSFIGGENV